MSSQSDKAVIRKPKLSKLSVLALLSSLLCVVAAGVALDVVPFRGQRFFIGTALMPYFDFVQFVVKAICGPQVDYQNDYAVHILNSGLILLFIPTAMALGFISTIRIDHSMGRLKGVSLGMTAIVIGLVSLLLTSPTMMQNFKHVGTTIKLVVMAKSSELCREEILVLGEALNRYADAHDGAYPQADKWSQILRSGHYLDGQDRLLWLSTKKSLHFALNLGCNEDSSGETVLLYESYPDLNSRGWREQFMLKHKSDKGKGGYVFLKNGELKFITVDTAAQLVWE